MLNSLYIYYDDQCGLCAWARNWLLRQPAWVRLHLIGKNSQKARDYFTANGIDAGELTVVSNEGAVYQGHRAWLMCLYVLRAYHRLARRLASPLLLPFARHAFEMVSKNRAAASTLLRLKSESDAVQLLARESAGACETGAERWLE
jgi:predicted DCC family thiol-disulfide oxidoreductase YuxK